MRQLWRQLVSRITMILLLAASVGVCGCTKYPQVSFTNLKYVAALRTACSAKDPAMLSKTSEVIDREHKAGNISDTEAESYRSIIATAKAGQWEEAERECHRFQQDQLAK